MLGHRARTFHVAGHHYALVAVEGLDPGRSYPYTVALDGATAWPEPGASDPPSLIRPIHPEDELRIIFGSCRASAPHEPPFTLPRDQHPLGRGPDALRAVACRLRQAAPAAWPRALVLLGDQIYADDVSPRTRAFIHTRRDTRQPPGEEVADFEEYARLYQEAWQEPDVRWLLSTVASTMLWDDHEVHDDWNISHEWVERMRSRPWWEERLVGAFMSYWLYQHLGNLSFRELAADELFARVQTVDDAEPMLRAFATEAARRPDGARWSFCRDFGRTRLLAVDCRAGRVLTPGARSMLDEAEWRWVEEQAAGELDHLLLALSDPYLLAPAIHHLEAWNEAVCDGAWGRLFATLGERLRRTVDLDHWAAFRDSFERLTALLRAVAVGRRGRAPATIVALSGDVHNCYLARGAFPNVLGVQSAVFQVVCSPLRNPLPSRERRVLRLLASRAAELIGRGLTAAARVPAPSIRWRYLAGPAFGNQIGTLELRGRQAHVRVEQAVRSGDDSPCLETVFEQRLA